MPVGSKGEVDVRHMIVEKNINLDKNRNSPSRFSSLRPSLVSRVVVSGSYRPVAVSLLALGGHLCFRLASSLDLVARTTSSYFFT